MVEDFILCAIERVKMKIGIVTSNASFLDNYGAVLQAYALSKQLTNWGHNAEIINYRYSTGQQIVEADSKVDRSFYARIRYVISRDVSLRQKFSYRASRKKREEQTELFRNFVKKMIPINLGKSVTYKDLCRDKPDFDCLICGSDQVWNPLIHANQNDPGFFLQFGSQQCKRIAYAPSFGISTLPDESKINLKEYTERFNALSVREISGAAIMKEICGVDVPVVLDPTMMADSMIWKEFNRMPSGMPERYILVYRFGRMNYMERQIKHITSELNLPVFEIPVSIESYGKGSKLIFGVGPEEFVTLIRNAKMVLTDSFHASVFSILNHTPFYTFLRQGKNEKNSMNSRMENLLEMVGLQSRLIYPDDPEVDFTDIHFDDVDEILNVKRATSQKFLRDALENSDDL